MANASDLSLLDPDELETRLAETRRELFNLRFQLATGQLDNSSRLGHVRRDVARILTVLREREIAEIEGTYVSPTAAQQDAARAHLAAQDEAIAAAQHAHDHDHDHDDQSGGEIDLDDVPDAADGRGLDVEDQVDADMADDADAEIEEEA